MSIADYLEELRDPEKKLTSGGLAQLSGLIAEEEAAFVGAWQGIPTARRLEILTRLVEMADDSAGMDFYSVFSHALHDEEPAVRRSKRQLPDPTNPRRAGISWNWPSISKPVSSPKPHVYCVSSSPIGRTRRGIMKCSPEPISNSVTINVPWAL